VKVKLSCSIRPNGRSTASHTKFCDASSELAPARLPLFRQGADSELNRRLIDYVRIERRGSPAQHGLMVRVTQIGIGLQVLGIAGAPPTSGGQRPVASSKNGRPSIDVFSNHFSSLIT
jgi:hypothetical protein